MLGAELKTGGGGVGGKARGREESLEAGSLKNRRPKLSLRVLSFLIRVASYYVILKKAVEIKVLYRNSVNRSTWSYENRVSKHFVIFYFSTSPV